LPLTIILTLTTSLPLGGGSILCLMTFIIIQGDGTLRFADLTFKGDYKWFSDGQWMHESVGDNNVFPSTTNGLQAAHERANEVRRQELIDNHYDNPRCQATEAELMGLEQIVAA